MALTDFIFKPLTRTHFITWAASIVSLIFSIMYADKVTMEQKFSLQELVEKDKEVMLKDIEGGMFSNMNSLWILAISEMIVVGTMTVHVFRRLFGCLPDLYSGMTGVIASVLHIASYTLSHFAALLSLYVMAGYKDYLGMVTLLVVTLSAEGLQHLMSNPNSRIGEGRATLVTVSSVGLLVFSIFIGIGLRLQDSAGMDGATEAFVILVICEALKFLNELLQGEPTVFGYKLSFWKNTVDSRSAQAVLDAMIKTGLMWYMNLSYFGKHGGLGDVDIEGGKTIALAVTLIVGGLFFLVSILAYWIPALRVQQDTEASKAEYPSASMDEKERMLQVA
tara:strand:- start:202 stop:1206 length:1005 start_codon:yes stop_codon:yes gene_type:complete